MRKQARIYHACGVAQAHLSLCPLGDMDAWYQSSESSSLLILLWRKSEAFLSRLPGQTEKGGRPALAVIGCLDLLRLAI